MANLGKMNEHREYKQDLSELKKGLIALTAMLNTYGSGKVFFGVNEEGEVVGVEIGKSTLKSIMQTADEFIDPQIAPEISIEYSSDGKKFISIIAEGSDTPYLFKSRAYVREGCENRRATHSDIRKMVLNSIDILKDTVSSNQNLTFHQLLDALNESRDTGHLRLKSLGLINPSGEFNIQGQLLSDQNIQPLAVSIFSGLDTTKLSIRKEFKGECILREIIKVLDYVQTLNEKVSDVSGPIKKETDLFDFLLFKEAWINACVHNNWSGQIPPTVHIFDNRIEIISYGDKPYALSKKEFFEGRSIPVNKSLRDIFVDAGVICDSSKGVPSIVDTYGENAYHFSGTSITVILTFTGLRTASSYRDNSSTTKTTKNETIILAALKEHPTYTLDQISQLVGLGRSTVGKIVPILQNRGLVERMGSYRDGVWVVHTEQQ